MTAGKREVDQLIAEHGIDAVVGAVRPMLTDERVARIESVLGARLPSVRVVLENLYDSHNGAAVIRSSEALGVADIDVVETVHKFDAASGVTIGCDKWIDLHRHPDPAACAAAQSEQGFSLCATLPGALDTVADLDPSKRWAVWFGNEHEGLTDAAVTLCDTAISIPMFGFSQSFNLSVSAAMVLAPLVSARRQHLGARGDMPADRRDFLRARFYAMGIRGVSEIVRRHVSK